ncbi:response regulator transcription factor [Undibacterium sp. LX40W]|uniref:Response regulator transcription factor n=1 Tax=Undibacterium nitidum TaxID=2762298 RepID=A0A923HM73_9BURK|nr:MULTISPECIES: response regulator transcription factor [Undibacterium]MBC3881607.1 response regulator transcription factor [Undibacterium nitidum]MBC3891610.1 response regulator transcription factor [Undibacterium sp. LX40W]
MNTEHSITVFLVDDHPVVREGLQALFSQHPEFKVIGEAADGISAVTKFDEIRADVALIDLRLPGQSGIEAIRAIRAQHPKAGLIAITSFDGDADARNALAAGANGFLFKGSPGTEILDAVRAVSAGGEWVTDEIAALLTATDGSDLSAREQEVLTKLAEGLRNQEIADQLGLSLSTVKCHVNAILDKLDAVDRTEAVVTALKRGIIHLPSRNW